MNNRVIKFRAWDGEKMYFHDDDSKHGQYELCFSDIAGWNMKDSKSPYWRCGQSSERADKSVLMQFTGLHDKNGKEIYQGDAIKNEWGTILVIEWDNDRAGFAAKGFHMTLGDMAKSEVVGNIYENPELLK